MTSFCIARYYHHIPFYLNYLIKNRFQSGKFEKITRFFIMIFRFHGSLPQNLSLFCTWSCFNQPAANSVSPENTDCSGQFSLTLCQFKSHPLGTAWKIQELCSLLEQYFFRMKSKCGWTLRRTFQFKSYGKFSGQAFNSRLFSDQLQK